jgi:hypothetical protein
VDDNGGGQMQLHVNLTLSVNLKECVIIREIVWFLLCKKMNDSDIQP